MEFSGSASLLQQVRAAEMITCSSAAPNGVNRDIAENQRKHLKAIRAKIEEKADGQKNAHNGIQKQIKMERLLRFRKGCGVRAEQGCFPLAGSNRSTPFVFYAAPCTRKQKRNSTPEQAGAAEYTRYPTVSAFGAPGKGVTRCFFPQYLSCLIPTPCSNRKFRTRYLSQNHCVPPRSLFHLRLRRSCFAFSAAQSSNLAALERVCSCSAP